MNVHLVDPTTDAQLRALDAAPADDPVDRGRQETALNAILASEPVGAQDDPSPNAVPTPIRRRGTTRWVALAGAAAAVTAGALVLPGLGGGETAYASWTAAPTRVAPDELGRVTDSCQTLADQPPPEGLPPGVTSPPTANAADLTLLLGERRGDWVFTSMTASSTEGTQWVMHCLAELPTGSPDAPAHVSFGVRGVQEWAPPQGSEFIEGALSGFGGASLGASGPDEPASATDGWVGPDVVGVTIHGGGVTIEATLKDGRYAAWWPNAAFDRPEDLPSGGQWLGPPSPATYDLTLRDGTVLKNVTSTYRDPKTGEVSTH